MSGNIESKTSTLIVVILDESGSMHSKKADVLGGFNHFINKQKKIKSDDAKLFMVKFNTSVSILHSGIPITDVPKLSNQSYTPGGDTALYDAIAEGVRLAEQNKKSEDRVICVIMTDGKENASRETTKQQVTDIISGHEALGDWTFVYIGENPERWARDAGMAAGNAIQYDHTHGQMNFEHINNGIVAYRQAKAKHSFNFFHTKK